MSPGLLPAILSWATPPILGAVIGWVTNDIAIRMLFRPLKEIRVLGVRLPFTPGIFPKERHTLARSIGKMVSRELITEEALRAQIHSEKSLEALSRSVASVSAGVLQTPLGALSAAGESVFSASLRELLHEMLSRFLGSRALIYAVRDAVSRTVASLSARKVHELLGRFDLKTFVTGRLLPLLARDGTRQSVGRAIGSVLQEQAGSILSDAVLDSLADVLEPLVPPAVDRLAAWLRSPDVRGEMETRGRELLSRVLDKLNLLQRFLLSAGQYDRKLDEKMPEIVEDTIKALEDYARDPERQRQLLAVLVEAARDWRDGLASGSTDRLNGGRLRRLANGAASIVERLLAGLTEESAREKLYAVLEKGLLGEGDPSVGGFALRTLGIREEEIVEYISNQLLAYLSRPETAKSLSEQLLELAGKFLDENAPSPLGEILRIDAARKETLDAFLLAKLVELVDAKLPEILRGVDVEELVVRKIEGLDVKDVERLLLQVIASHLKWINVFGAILGFLIGLVQDVLRLLRLL
jgi:uncharacterized membrane protein YheB (UPF0754 family)